MVSVHKKTCLPFVVNIIFFIITNDIGFGSKIVFCTSLILPLGLPDRRLLALTIINLLSYSPRSISSQYGLLYIGMRNVSQCLSKHKGTVSDVNPKL